MSRRADLPSKHSTATLAARDSLIERYQKYVHRLVGNMIHVIGLPASSMDEYISAGYLGLVEAAERFDFKPESDFQAYARFRIRGAVIDHIRAHSEISGKAYRYARALRAAHDMHEGDGERVCENSLPERSIDPADRLAGVLDFAARGALAFRLTLTDAEEAEISDCAGQYKDAEQQMMAKQSAARFRALVARLPDKERLVVEEYYFKEKSFKQITDEYPSLSKSWVSRLHSRALRRLKDFYLESAGSNSQAGKS